LSLIGLNWEGCAAGEEEAEPGRISAVAPPGGAMADKADCGLRIGKAGEGEAGWGAVAGAAPCGWRPAFSASSNDSLVFMGLLKHGFEKTTAHRGYKMHGQKRGC